MSVTLFSPLFAITTIVSTATTPIPVIPEQAPPTPDVSFIYDEITENAQTLSVNAESVTPQTTEEGFTSVAAPPPPPPVVSPVTTSTNVAPSRTTSISVSQIPSNIAPLSGSGKNQFLQLATQYTGVPYVFGGATPGGWDCSGYVKWVAGQTLGINLPHGVSAITRSGAVHPVSRAEAQPGDLVVFPGNAHMGIFLGGNQMVHAPKPGDVTKIGTIWTSDVRFFSFNG
jgi:cell wall-associated NlpC family hydrolase